MIKAGETYERYTGSVHTVVEVGETWFGYEENGFWKRKLVLRVKLMTVVPAERSGEVIHETVPTGNLQSYGYIRLS